MAQRNRGRDIRAHRKGEVLRGNADPMAIPFRISLVGSRIAYKRKRGVGVVRLSKPQIATAQLDTAIALYLKGDDLVSAITLAGAAEEILGKLALNAGAKSAFDETLDRLCGMYEAAFNEKSDRKAFVELRNRARNEFKHIGLQSDVSVDLEREAVNMLRRAIDNYRKHDSAFRDIFRQFEQELLK
jgi:hypothetical protein